MSIDYIILAIAAVVLLGGGLFLLSQAKTYRDQHKTNNRHHDGVKHA